MPYPGPRLAIPSPLYCSVLGVLMAKPLFLAIYKTGEGTVDASIKPAWKSVQTGIRIEFLQNTVGWYTPFRSCSLTEKAGCDGFRTTAGITSKSIANTSRLGNLCRKGWRDSMKVVLRRPKVLKETMSWVFGSIDGNIQQAFGGLCRTCLPHSQSTGPLSCRWKNLSRARHPSHGIDLLGKYNWVDWSVVRRPHTKNPVKCISNTSVSSEVSSLVICFESSSRSNYSGFLAILTADLVGKSNGKTRTHSGHLGLTWSKEILQDLYCTLT